MNLELAHVPLGAVGPRLMSAQETDARPVVDLIGVRWKRMPFVRFVQLEVPNAIDAVEAAFLRDELLGGAPSEYAVQAALKIEVALQEGVDVTTLRAEEMRAIVAALDGVASGSDPKTWSLGWIEHNMRRALGDPTVR
jgi:hypothetical protein